MAETTTDRTPKDVLLDEAAERLAERVPLLVLADWLDEQGDAAGAEACRFMAGPHDNVQRKKGEAPQPRAHRPYLDEERKLWAWFCDGKVDPALEDKESNLPEHLYCRLAGKVVANHNLYNSAREAIEDVLAAWGRPMPEPKKEEPKGE